MKLTPNQKKFCNLYGDPKSKFFGNATLAYLNSYPKSSKSSARRSASELLTNPDILAEIDSWLDKDWLTDEYVDGQLCFLIRQSADLTAKLGAIKEYNRVKRKLVNKVDVLSPIVYLPKQLPENYN